MTARFRVQPVHTCSVSQAGSVAVGVVAWAIGVLVLCPGWPEAMLLLASFVIVPLGLDMAAFLDPGRRSLPWPREDMLPLV